MNGMTPYAQNFHPISQSNPNFNCVGWEIRRDLYFILANHNLYSLIAFLKKIWSGLPYAQKFHPISQSNPILTVLVGKLGVIFFILFWPIVICTV